MNALKAVAGGLVVAAGFLIGADPAQAGPHGPNGPSTKFSGGFGNPQKFGGGFGTSTKFHGSGAFHGGGVFHGGSGPFVPIHRHRWHDTSHYDFHPGGYVWNGFRWVYVPAHYDWHVDGHFDHFHH